MAPTTGPRPPSWLPTLRDLGESVLTLLTTAVGLGVAVAVVDGVRLSSPWAVVLAAGVVAAGDLLLRTPLRFLARSGSALVALALGLLAQVAVLWVALSVVPGIGAESLWTVLGVLVVSAIVMAVGRWIIGAGNSDYVVSDLVRRARRQARREGVRAPAAGEPRSAGMLVVQLDGVAAPVLREAIEAGLAPNVQRWMAAGTHTLEEWWARIPSTTPASQAGLLHGDSSQIPAFRWWDRDLGRLVVTNHPDDAALVERRLTTGKGLLAGGGTAVSTMFSGDAATSFVVMSRSRTKGPDGGLGPGPAYLRFFASPFVLARAVSLSVGEMVKELYQAHRQRVRGVEPRVSRAGWYVVLRGITNVLLRDLNTSLVAEALLRGSPTIYVDLVDYDEIAHHAGPTRPESLRSLEGLDRVLGTVERVVAVAPRDYEIVVLSDHGQALGATYEQVAGETLLDSVRALMAEPSADGVTSDAGEEWGLLNALVNSALNLSHRPTVLGPDQGRPRRPPADDLPDVVTAGSGNLGLVWFPQVPHRLTLEELQGRWPGLVTGLAARPGVGVVVVDTEARGLVAVGPRGLVLLEQPGAPVEGEDPLLPYGPRGRPDLLRAARLPHTGDLLLVSTVTDRGHIHAFEGQVGSHGGIGGAQNHAFLLHPAGWTVDDELREAVGDDEILVGAEAVHEQLVRWADAAGLRP
ncbi:alkaline phosphatase family protein [Cellulomonas fengjieae]|uniref:alkaline phosphatase family protein n=1 Tax=Cellulomonas fengjieae TaxID=2819978 RepID=UPI001AAF6DE8|nr:alkaline phosphatase family protein [Cellulomonas fengjieae]MBO3103142.1 alkaline phosphatase family protein [Cellulomonas fengjieae]